jgi:Fe-S-cluster-containing dehydrogenase component
MTSMDRRNFLKLSAVTGATSLVGSEASAATRDPGEDWSILVDLGQCIGCRSCEVACAEANGLPEPDFEQEPTAASTMTENRWTAVSRHDTSKGEVYVKRQCMHCVSPACAAGCLTKALDKEDEGPVTWTGSKCMGCRYCMVSCPFDAPKFEYQSANPRIQKCRMCFERVRDGGQPACVENCGGGALTFGKRAELLEVARQRIYQNEGAYVPHIYGEHEAGGTDWLYISPVPFEELGFRTDLGTEAYPELTRDFLTAVPLVLLVFPALMAGLRQATGSAAVEAAPAPAALPAGEV